MQLPIFDLMNNIEAGDRTSFEIAFGNCHLERSGPIIYNVNPLLLSMKGCHSVQDIGSLQNIPDCNPTMQLMEHLYVFSGPVQNSAVIIKRDCNRGIIRFSRVCFAR